MLAKALNPDRVAQVREWRVPREHDIPEKLMALLTPANLADRGWHFEQPQPATPGHLFATKQHPDNPAVTYEVWLDADRRSGRAYRITTVVPPAPDPDDELAATPPVRTFRLPCRVEEALSIF